MSRRAQIPMQILPLMALVVSAAVLFSFLSFENLQDNQSIELSNLMSNLNFNKKYILEQSKIIVQDAIKSCINCSIEEYINNTITSANVHDLQLPGQGNFFGEVRNNKFIFSIESDRTFKFNVDNLFVSSEINNNKIVRNFNLCQIFNSNGEFLGNCNSS